MLKKKLKSKRVFERYEYINYIYDGIICNRNNEQTASSLTKTNYPVCCDPYNGVIREKARRDIFSCLSRKASAKSDQNICTCAPSPIKN